MASLQIRESKRGSRRRTLTCDGEIVRTTSLDVVRTLELTDGDYPDMGVILDQVTTAEPHCALDRALRLLNYRERSVQELRSRLLDDGYPEPLVEDVTARLVELELLDDARFAGCLVRSKRASGWGRSRISQALKAKGVSQAVSERALDEGGEREFDRALAIALRRPPVDRAGVEKTLARLLRKGYSFDVALRAAKSSLDASDDDEPLE